MSFEKQKIQYYPIAPITDFVLTEHTNNLYKQVANSSIDLAKKCAEKINEVINSFNELAKEKWEKIHEQDGSIRSAILYMKDNLLNTVDSLLKTKGDEMMDNAVKEYLGTLKAELDHVEKRLNNLLGSVTEGSTTMDAEIIDLRVGIDGTTYNSAGESVRKQLEGLYLSATKQADLSNYKIDTYVRKTNGTLKTLDGSNFYCSVPIEITGTKLYVRGKFQIFSDCDLINFYSSSELNETSFISSVTPTKVGEVNEITIPNGAVYIVVCTSKTLYPQTYVYFNGEDLKTKIHEELLLKPINLEVEIEDKFIRSNGSSVDSTGMVISKPVEITNTKLYYKGQTKTYSSTKLINFYSNTEVSFYGYIGSYEVTSGLLQEIPIPEGAKYFRVCTGLNQLPLSKFYFNNTPLCKDIKRINSIMSKLVNSDRTIKVKLIGDSITNGLRGTGYDKSGNLIYGSNYVNQNGYCWANELKSYLESKFNCEVLNYGVSGIGSDVLLSKMSNVIAEDDDIIICSIGTNDRVIGNDAYTGKPRTLESIYKNMNGIYTYAKRLNKEIIFITPIPSSVNDESGRNYHTEDIANLYLKLSEEKGIEIINLHSILTEYCDVKNIELDSLLNDGLHPNDNGYEVMFKLICKHLGFNPKRKNANW